MIAIVLSNFDRVVVGVLAFFAACGVYVTRNTDGGGRRG